MGGVGWRRIRIRKHCIWLVFFWISSSQNHSLLRQHTVSATGGLACKIICNPQKGPNCRLVNFGGGWEEWCGRGLGDTAFDLYKKNLTIVVYCHTLSQPVVGSPGKNLIFNPKKDPTVGRWSLGGVGWRGIRIKKHCIWFFDFWFLPLKIVVYCVNTLLSASGGLACKIILNPQKGPNCRLVNFGGGWEEWCGRGFGDAAFDFLIFYFFLSKS